MNALLDKRLTKLELVHTPPAELRERQRFFVKGYGDSDVADFFASMRS